MCGISGIFHYAEPDRPVDPVLLGRMTEVLAHRGPDGHGFHVDRGLGLGHRRLAIIDLTDTGRQPMPSVDGSCWITYNGEFYNHAEFRRGLQSKGVVFRGTSDTETLVNLLQWEGPDVLSRVNGIFGFACWDSRNRRLLLARDALGVKQVYYHDDGKRIVFASELKALLQVPDVPRVPDFEALNEYLHFHTPLFERTFFRGIQQLRPGELLEIGASGIRSRRHGSIQDFRPLELDSRAMIDSLKSTIAAVVRDQLMSDVPVGAFFSGGIDSSAVAAFAQQNGTPPRLFGVHFSQQGVIDERPYQEAAARSLGLNLDLITLDGETFPDDLVKLIYHQDQPMIGAAMIPMYHVSKLAARSVKVCLGGQGADEMFGGYARYALTRPFHVLSSLFLGRRQVQSTKEVAGASVGGNLLKQLGSMRTMTRLARNMKHAASWRARYFDNLAQVPEQSWRAILAPDLVSRRACWGAFNENLSAWGIQDPATAAMFWDVQVYLPGLFHQDDRMSMANSLESRVPFADPRLAAFAFRVPFEMKFRGGASKWILRQAVADAIPEQVLNRRKVGFDTPAELWIKSRHSGFVRDLLLSPEARRRGFWNHAGVAALLSRPGRPHWFDTVWKAICIEAWARQFLDGHLDGSRRQSPEIRPAALAHHHGPSEWMQEIRETGLKNIVFRAGWEVKTRSGILKFIESAPAETVQEGNGRGKARILEQAFADPDSVRERMSDRLSFEARERLRRTGQNAAEGRILCFGRWEAEFGKPINWQINPLNGRSWSPREHWSRALRAESEVGDVKATWEVARFPQAYHLARAATFFQDAHGPLGSAFAAQVSHFIRANPWGKGIHWNSGQEISIRLMAWTFGTRVFGAEAGDLTGARQDIIRAAEVVGEHLGRTVEHIKRSVPNNHLIGEGLGLYLASLIAPHAGKASRWEKVGLGILDETADRQFYRDGGYVQNAHNYHRVALQYFLFACMIRKSLGLAVPSLWIRALDRSVHFLVSHQNGEDGRLPNYGANDGALPCVLSTCDFSDFRPTLQAASILSRGTRIYPPGPWDEEAAWWLGPEVLDLPLREPVRTSVSFATSGYHVLRARREENFGTFRCGTLRDRFSQIDMLHLDVWWKGQNVLTDAGSYLYNGEQKWHDHFFRTECHNTLQVDSQDQMLHYRRFKPLYLNRAKLLYFEDVGDWASAGGEHYGYRRHPGGCIHRRSVLFVKDDLWIVLDFLSGEGRRSARLHWLCGPYPAAIEDDSRSVSLQTPKGTFGVTVVDASGQPIPVDHAQGQESPPRGWLSRYYGEKVAVPSLVYSKTAVAPITMISILSGQPYFAEFGSGGVRIEGANIRIAFQPKEGRIEDLKFERR